MAGTSFLWLPAGIFFDGSTLPFFKLAVDTTLTIPNKLREAMFLEKIFIIPREQFFGLTLPFLSRNSS